MRSTAVTRRPERPQRAWNDGSMGRVPWPHSHTWVASAPSSAALARTISFDASMMRRSSGAAGPSGRMAGFPVRSWGGTQSALPSSAGATITWRYITPGWNHSPSRPPPSSESTASMMGRDSSVAMWWAEKSTMIPGD